MSRRVKQERRWDWESIIRELRTIYPPYSLVHHAELMIFCPIDPFYRDGEYYTASGVVRELITRRYLISKLIKKKIIKRVAKRLYKVCSIVKSDEFLR